MMVVEMVTTVTIMMMITCEYTSVESSVIIFSPSVEQDINIT
jgi:hypothetical protein